MFNKIFKKTISYALLTSVIMNNLITVQATQYHNSISHVDEHQIEDNLDSNTTVYAEVGSAFKVIIPKHIILDGTSKTGAYTVSVTGDIAGTETINVVPDESFALSSVNLNNVTASIDQDKTSWTYDEMLEDSAVIGNGAIDAADISAGSWNGNFNFNIKLDEITSSEVSMLKLSANEVAMGAGDSVQINAYYEDEIVNDYVTWNSDNENITVNNGLIETKANVQVGDTATVTVTAEIPTTMSIKKQINAELTATFTVTVIDMVYTSEGEIISSVNLKAGESKEVEVTIIPASASGNIIWSQTAIAGINLVKNGNKVTIKIANDMEPNKTYNLIATYGDFSKTLPINIIPDHEHDYKSEVTTEANCTEAGLKTYTCACGDTYTEEISAIGHAWGNDYTVDVEPTCTKEGSKSVHCANCDAIKYSTSISKLEHDYESSVTKEATCTVDGNKHYECKNCDSKYDETIESTGHIYESTNYVTDKAATCTEDGSKSVHCNVCNAKISGTETIIPKTGHSYGEATYSWTGYDSCNATRNCTKCLGIESEGVKTTYAVTRAATCTVAGEGTYTATFENSAFKPQTKTTQISIIEHDYSQVKGKVEATCTTSGYGYSCCSICGKENPDSNSIIRVEALGHSLIETITEANCELGGYTTYECERCDYSYVTNQVEALGHDYEIINSTKSDCNTKGSITYKCNTCGIENTIETEIGEHTWNEGVIKLATCTEEGYTTYTCLVCNETKIEDQQSIKEHNYDDGLVTTPATCETYGEKKFTCLDCGHEKTEEIEMYGHMYYGDTFICSICSKSIIWNFDLNKNTKTMVLLSMKDEYKEELKNVVIPSKVMIDDVLYKIEFINSTYDGLAENEDGYKIPTNPKGPFVGNTTIETVHFEDGATMTNNDMSCMFLGCYSLKSVTNIPDSVENMKMTFEYCTSLESVPKLPQNLKNLTDTFKFCTGLTNVGMVEIPENVRVMAGAFHSCTNMYGTVYIYATEINEIAPNGTGVPFMPCFRSFYNTAQNAPQKIKLCVYKYKNKECYEKSSKSNSFVVGDLEYYTDTYKTLYNGNNENVVYYYTDNTYTVRSDVKTNYKLNNSSTGNYVTKSTWKYK